MRAEYSMTNGKMENDKWKITGPPHLAFSFFRSRHIVRGIITHVERGSRERDSLSSRRSASSSLI
jgi:hypothetical protein